MKTALLALAVAILLTGCATSRTPDQVRADMEKAEHFRRVLNDLAPRSTTDIPNAHRPR